ncbi:MAG: NAD-dependent epimerase/dehydratase family protein [Saprospiraceae bacterium]
MTSAAVTGANGHIGNVLCRELSGQGIDTRAIIHHRSDALSSVAIKRVVADIEDLQQLINVFSGVDTVFHLAARISLNPRQADATQKINWQGTRNVIEACRQAKVKTLVYFSSIHVLDPEPQHETMDECRVYNQESNLAYDVSKIRAELEVLQVKDFRVIVILPTSVIGPLISVPHSWDRQFEKFIIALCQQFCPMDLTG